MMAAGVPLARFAHAYPNQIATSEMRESVIVVPRRYPADAEPGDFETRNETQAVARITPARNVGRTQERMPSRHSQEITP